LSIRFANPHVIDLKLLCCGRISEHQLAQVLHARLALHANGCGNIAYSGTVVFVSNERTQMIEDHGFLRRSVEFRNWGLPWGQKRQKEQNHSELNKQFGVDRTDEVRLRTLLSIADRPGAGIVA
jgi:hypothetical protein